MAQEISAKSAVVFGCGNILFGDDGSAWLLSAGFAFDSSFVSNANRTLPRTGNSAMP